MRLPVLTLGLALATAATALPVSSAEAQRWRGHDRGDYREYRQEQRECRRELRRADSRREYRREMRECRRELAEARRDLYDGRYAYRGRGYYRDNYRDGGRYWDGYRWRYRY